jgi:Fibronectin type III domain
MAGEDYELTDSHAHALKMKPFRRPQSAQTTSQIARKSCRPAETLGLKRKENKKRAAATLRFATLFLVILSTPLVISSQAHPGNPKHSPTPTDSVTLAWNADPATSNPGTNPAGYMLYIGTSSGNYTQTTNVGTATAVTVSSLQSGTTYYFAVTAYNSAGVQSPFSNQVSYKAP